MELQDFVAMGIAVIPLYPGRKNPEVTWQRYQTQLPTPAELARWFRLGKVYNAAVVCGWQGLTVLDFDTLDGYTQWLRWAADFPRAREVAEASYLVATARGVHVYALLDTPARCGKFAWGDIKGQGGYVLIPPSIHPSGVPYVAFNDNPIVRARKLDDLIPDPPAERVVIAPTPHVYAGQTAWPLTTAEEIKARVPITSLFPDARPSGGHWLMTQCPWHDDRLPSLRLDTTAGVAVCFAGCNDGKPLDVIAAYAKLRGLDNRAAFRELRMML